MPTNKPHDPVNSPKGYNSHPSGVETVEVTEHFSAMLGSAVKYVWRRELKGNEVQDLQKAAWCFRREAARLRRFSDADARDTAHWHAAALRVVLTDRTILAEILGMLIGSPYTDDPIVMDQCAKLCDEEVLRLQRESRNV